MLGLAEMDGLTEGDWDNVGEEVGMFIRVDDGSTKALADFEGEDFGANLAGRQSSPSNPQAL